MTAGSSQRRLLPRLGLALAALLAAVVLLEIALRVLARFVDSERGGVVGGRGATTILCVGDSHTFGLHVLPSLSYPAQLQQLVDPSGVQVGVVNYGVPGRNSAALLAKLPDYLERVRPSVLLVLVGFNDSWSSVGEAEDRGTFAAALRDLRVARLVRLALLEVRGGDASPRVVEKDGRTVLIEDGVERPAAQGALETLAGAALVARVRKNLERVIALAREQGVVPVLLTYATEDEACFVDLNAGVRALAADLGVKAIDAAAALRGPIAADGYATLFFPDDHPNARGYAYVAEAVARELRAAGLLPESASPVEVELRAPTLRVVPMEGASGTHARFVVAGAPGREFQVALSPVREPAIELHGATLPIGEDPMVARCLESLNLRGRFGPEGTAEVEVDLALLGAVPGQRLFAVAASLAGHRAAVSDVVELRAGR